MKIQSINRENFPCIALTLATIWGIVLILLQFLQDRGVWGDESFYTNNILFKDYSDFWLPLDNYVAAPYLFLIIQKFIITSLGAADIHFRILPLTAAVLAIFMLYKLTDELFKNVFYSLLSVSLFVLSPAVIYFSSEIKPYIIECFFAILLLYLAMAKSRNEYALLITGCVAIFMANGIVILLFCISLHMLFEIIRSRKMPPVKTTITLLAWLFHVCILYYFFVHVHSGGAAWQQSYDIHGGFLFSDVYQYSPYRAIFALSEFFASSKGLIYDNFYPALRSLVVDQKMIITSFQSLIDALPIGKVFFTLVFIIGLFARSTKKNSKFFFYLLLPITIHFILNIFRIYPIGVKSILCHFPAIIIILLMGLEHLETRFHKNQFLIRLFATMAILFIAINLKSVFPYSDNNTKEALNYLLDLKKQDPNIEITLISYSTMTNNYGVQKKYKDLISHCQIHSVRVYPITTKNKGEFQWFYVSPEEREKMIIQLKKQWEIVEEIDSINLYKVRVKKES